MLRYLAIVGTLLFAQAAWAVPAFVQANTGTGGSGTHTTAFSSNNTAGNAIILGILMESATATVTSVSDTRGNIYVAATTPSAVWNSSNRIQIYYAMNIGAGANTITVTISESVRVTTHFSEYSGLKTTGALDVTASGTPSTNPSSGSATTTLAGDLIYGFAATAGTATAGAGNTLRTEDAWNVFNYSQDRIAGAAGSYASTFDSGATGVAQMAAFKSADAVEPTSTPAPTATPGAATSLKYLNSGYY